MSGDTKILYLQPGTKAFAGIERVVHSIAAELARDKEKRFDIDVLLISKHDGYPKPPYDYNVIFKQVSSRISRFRAFRETAKRKNYDLIIIPQIEPAVMFWVACLGLKPKIVMHLHGNPRREAGNWKSKILFFLMKHLVIKHLFAVFGTSPRQLQAFASDFKSELPLVWTPNPVRTFGAINLNISRSPNAVTFVNLGRYDFQKGQDILIKAFAQLYNRRNDVRLKLIGHGHDKASLEEMIDRLNLSQVVTLEHHPENPERALLSSDIYVSSSRWEGWSLAICEALQCGLPVISIDCEFGPSDILTDERLGKLVPPRDEKALTETMAHYCNNIEVERAHATFRRDYISRYAVERVVKIHAKAILEISATNR